jgi:hypothetical protein
MPLTEYQARLGRLLAENRSEDSYLAGGAAILAEPNTLRYSQDLDYFHDSSARVATAYQADFQTLIGQGYEVEPDIMQPGYIRAIVRNGNQATKVEWAQDSTWRFMPVIRSEAFGFQLHPVDLATNKVLALAGRDEPRDLVDTLYLHGQVLELGPLVWAAVGKDPGFSPRSLLELLRRRGKIRPEDLERLDMAVALDVQQLKQEWMTALQEAETFVVNRPPDEVGCLYYSRETGGFVNPNRVGEPVVPHYGRPGGVLPNVAL